MGAIGRKRRRGVGSIWAGGVRIRGADIARPHHRYPDRPVTVGSIPMPGLDWVDGYEHRRTVYVGIDIGQKRDPTAIAVVESGPVEAADGSDGRMVVFVVRHLERLNLGTTYPDVAARVVEVLTGVKGHGASIQRVYVDATGVGQPVVDLLDRVGAANYGQLVPVYFTHGDRRARGDSSPWPVTLGKAWLVSRLQVLLQDQRLMFPATLPEREALVRELLDYEIRIGEDANDRYGAFRVGAHDDMVTAVGLACQEEVRYIDGPLVV